jgi:FkbM family methyltransferase
MTMIYETLNRDAFAGRLYAALENFKENREARLNLLSKEESVIVYSYGTRGADFAKQLRSAGIDCLIFDNAQNALSRAVADGFKTTSDPSLDLPLIVAAGQNQLSILSGLTRPAYSLAEGLYAFDLTNQCAKARLFSEAIPAAGAELYQIYRDLDPSCQQDFLNVLLFRVSLDVSWIASSRKSISQMWIPPAAVRTISSFCDVGAYDGDTLISMKAAFPDLKSALAVEPNPDLVAKIEAGSRSSELKCRVFIGAAWSHKTRLSSHVFQNGMMTIKEDVTGNIDADGLDNISSLEPFDYVKFDVEGSEAHALQGARSLLRSSRCIAIAGYHLPNDLLEVPNNVAVILGPKYETEWRRAFHHYSECFDDSIFYFYRTNQ